MPAPEFKVNTPTEHYHKSLMLRPNRTIMQISNLHSSEVSHAEDTYRARTLEEGA